MHRTFQIRRSTAVLTVLIAVLAGGLAYSWMTNRHQIPVFVANAHAASMERAGGITSFAPVVKKAMPAVVNISSSKVVKVNQGQQGMFNDPFFRQFFGGRMPQMPQSQREHSLGSGVVVSPDGYILTNNHVVEGATDVKVLFSDHRQIPAKVIGTDEPTDIAVLKVDRKDLPVLPLGESQHAEVGDVVLAIGNPFGLHQTVTMGIISAKGRAGLGIEKYEDFIQTDAAINPGNSGGALINSQGELIGINTAILSGSGGNQGVGFAIPVDLARTIMNQILKNGKVTRGFIGILPQEITNDMAQAFGLPAGQRGVAVAEVEPNSPASSAGLKVGDVITAINGHEVDDANEFRLNVAGMAPGTHINLKVLRDGKTVNVPLTLAENTEVTKGAPGESRGGPSGGQASALEGVQVQTLTPEMLQQMNAPTTLHGVIVTDVDENSQAAEAGLQQNDIITQVNRQNVTNAADFERLVKQGAGKPVLLLVNSGGNIHFMLVQPK